MGFENFRQLLFEDKLFWTATRKHLLLCLWRGDIGQWVRSGGGITQSKAAGHHLFADCLKLHALDCQWRRYLDSLDLAL